MYINIHPRQHMSFFSSEIEQRLHHLFSANGLPIQIKSDGIFVENSRDITEEKIKELVRAVFDIIPTIVINKNDDGFFLRFIDKTTQERSICEDEREQPKPKNFLERIVAGDISRVKARPKKYPSLATAKSPATESKRSPFLAREGSKSETRDLIEITNLSDMSSTARQRWEEILKYRGDRALRLKREGRNTEFIQLWEYIMNSKEQPDSAVAASNAITALNLAGYNFSKCDLSRVKIPGANLSGGLFYQINFTEAHLEGVNLSLTYLVSSQFARSRLKKVDFGYVEVNAYNFANIRCLATSRSGEFYAIVGFNSVHSIIPITPTKDCVNIRQIDTNIRVSCLAFTANDHYLIFAGDREEIHVWDINKNQLHHKFRKSNKLSVGLASDSTISPNSSLIALVDITGDVYIWDCIRLSLSYKIMNEKASGTPLFIPKIDDSSIRVCDGEHLIIPTREGIKLIHFPTESVIKIWDHGTSYRHIVLSSDAKLMVGSTMYGDKIIDFIPEEGAIRQHKISIWSFDPSNNLLDSPCKEFSLEEQITNITPYIDSKYKDMAIIPYVFALSNKGDLLALGFRGGIKILDTKNWSIISHFGTGSDENVSELQFFDSGSIHLISIINKKQCIIWKLATITNKQETLIEQHTLPIQSLQLTGNNRYVLSLSGNILRLWGSSSANFLRKLENITKFAVSPQSDYLIVLLNTNCAKLYKIVDFSTPEKIFKCTNQSNFSGNCEIPSNETIISFDEILDVSFFSSNALLLLGKQEIRIYLIKENHLLPNNELFKKFIKSIPLFEMHTISSDSKWLAFVNSTVSAKDLHIWNFDTNKSFKFKCQATRISQLSISSTGIVSYLSPELDGREGLYFVYPNESKFVKFNFYERLVRMKSTIRTISCHPTLPILALGCADGVVNLIDIGDLEHPKYYHEFVGHAREITQLSFSLDGKKLISASNDHSFQIWTLEGTEWKEATLQCRSKPYHSVFKKLNLRDAAEFDSGFLKSFS